MPSWTKKDMPDLMGKTAVVTGANTGLGYQTALALAEARAHVVLTARDKSKGNEAVARIRAASPAAMVEFRMLDLASLASVEEFAQEAVQDHVRIDLLINNAGVASPARRLTTSDGFEIQFGVNFLGHFALTARLLPLLLKANAPRVVSLSSIVHKFGNIDLDDLMSERRYSPVRSYSQSKLATLVFAHELQRRSVRNRWGLISVAAHPGIARTELTRARPGQPVPGFNRFFDILAPLFAGTAASGALPTLYAATATDVVPGGYYGPTGWAEIKGQPGPAMAAPSSHEQDVAETLWTRAEGYTRITF